jgi:hypothetical protein
MNRRILLAMGVALVAATTTTAFRGLHGVVTVASQGTVRFTCTGARGDSEPDEPQRGRLPAWPACCLLIGAPA